MVAMAKNVVRLMSCGLLLCLGLSTTAQAGNAAVAAEDLKHGQTDRTKNEQDPMKGRDTAHGQTITGEVLRVEGETYFVKGLDGKEVRLQTDHNTQTLGPIHQGDRIEATVNEQNHALSIRSARGTEAGRSPDAGSTPEASRDVPSSAPRER